MRIFPVLCSVLFSSSVAVAHGFGNFNFSIPHLVGTLGNEPPKEISALCLEHLDHYGKNVESNSFWALQMADSITKFPDGILLGRTHFPGHFDECVEAAGDKFQGKHCMVQVNMKRTDQDIVAQYSASLSALLQQKFYFGLCVPSTCSAQDVKFLIENLDEENLINVELNETDCSVKGYRPFRSEDWTTVCIISIIVVIALLSTVFDIYQRFVLKKENPSQLWTSFSFYTNGKQLFRISQTTAQLKCLHGMRFLSMCWVILGHCYFSFLFSTAINKWEIPKYMNDKSFTPVSNAFVSVDSFFFLSGLLVCLVFFRDIAKKGTYDVPVAFLHRYIRLTPPFALLILIQGTIISRIGNGPFWNGPTDTVEKNCRESWWSGILYVQNYLNPMAMCLGQAWYLSADMQMYWVSPLILYPILWFPSYAPFFLGILVLAASFTNFGIGYVNKLEPNLLLRMGGFTNNQFELEYTPFHTRMAPWLIGLATGYVVCGIQAKKINIRLSKFWTLCGWLAALGILGGSIFGIVRFFPENYMSQLPNDYTATEAAFYLAFHRVGWALGLGWVVIACVSGHGGPINDFLSMDIFQPLAKLSYCNFLIHMTLQNYRVNSSRTNPYIRHFEVVYFYFGDLLISHLVSIPIVLLFEFPFMNIDRHFLQKLVVFPLGKLGFSREKAVTEKPEKPEESPEDVEKGKTNPAFNDT